MQTAQHDLLYPLDNRGPYTKGYIFENSGSGELLRHVGIAQHGNLNPTRLLTDEEAAELAGYAVETGQRLLVAAAQLVAATGRGNRQMAERLEHFVAGAAQCIRHEIEELCPGTLQRKEERHEREPTNDRDQ